MADHDDAARALEEALLAYADGRTRLVLPLARRHEVAAALIDKLAESGHAIARQGVIEAGEGVRVMWDTPHVVRFSMSGYGLQHPVRCRPDLLGCWFNLWLATAGAPDMPPGLYLMRQGDDGPVYEHLPNDHDDGYERIRAALEADR